MSQLPQYFEQFHSEKKNKSWLFDVQLIQEIECLKEVRMNTEKGRVIALDIDNCSALGEDTNDILQIVALMTDLYADPTRSNDLAELLELLINPQLLVAVKKIKESIQPYIVFYSMKSGVVDGCTATDLQKEHILRKGLGTVSENGASTLTFKSGSLAEGFEYLYNQVATAESSKQSRAYYQLCRLGIITWGISVALGMPYAAPVYITNDLKNMDHISTHLGVEAHQAFLFDDKAEEHARILQLTDRQARMIQTQPFNLTTLSREHAEKLYTVLQQKFPLTDEFVKRYASLIAMASSKSGDDPGVLEDDDEGTVKKRWRKFAEGRGGDTDSQASGQEAWAVDRVLDIHAIQDKKGL